MGKEGLYVLRGKLAKKAGSGFSYGKTRAAITTLLLNFKVDEKDRLFERIGDVKVEDEKFDIPVRLNTRVGFGRVNNDIAKEAKICEVIIKLEEHFGIGSGTEETDIRIEKMKDEGIIPVSHFIGFEQKDFEE